MASLIDLTGQTFGHLEVINYLGCYSGGAHWKCRCLKCGAAHTEKSRLLRNGSAVQCDGCVRHERGLSSKARQWKRADIDRLCELWNKGAKTADIAACLGRSVKAVYVQIARQTKARRAFPRAVHATEDDLLGRTFGMRTIIAATVPGAGRTAMWLTQCQCGAEHAVPGDKIMTGHRLACKACSNRDKGKRRIIANEQKKQQKKFLSFAEIRARDRQIAARHAEAEAAFV